VQVFDSNHVAHFLSEATGVGAIERDSLLSVNHGEWSKAYFFRTVDGRELVARFSGTDEDFLKDERATRFASPRLPVPRVLEIGRAFDEYYAISERAFGDYVEERDAHSMERVLPSLLNSLDAMREVDLSGTDGFGLWRADGSAPHDTWRDVLLAVATDPPSSRTHGWRERLDLFPEADRVFQAAFDAIQRLADAAPDERHLLHSDLLNFNILISENQQVSSVLDWGSSMYGDFVWDLAWLTFWQPWYTAWASVDFVSAAHEHYARTGLKVPNFVERIRCCELAIGLDGMAYQALTGRADDLQWTTRRVQSLLRV
jgi:hygromycin-B 4-O-kinase